MTDAADRAVIDTKPFRLWPALVEAIRGSQQDFTAGPIGRAILLLALAMESVFGKMEDEGGLTSPCAALGLPAARCPLPATSERQWPNGRDRLGLRGGTLRKSFE